MKNLRYSLDYIAVACISIICLILVATSSGNPAPQNNKVLISAIQENLTSVVYVQNSDTLALDYLTGSQLDSLINVLICTNSK